MSSLKDFVLVGGTNLALQRGHRISIDIDLFTARERDSINRQAIQDELYSAFPANEGLETLDKCEIGYHLFIGENGNDTIKLDLWCVDPFVFPITIVDGIRLADIREIVAFKLMAATQEIRRQKDFWDINELLHLFSLEEMIAFAEKRYPYNFDRTSFINSLKTVDTVELAPEGIQCLRGCYWDLIVMDLKKEAKRFSN